MWQTRTEAGVGEFRQGRIRKRSQNSELWGENRVRQAGTGSMGWRSEAARLVLVILTGTGDSYIRNGHAGNQD